MTRHIEFPSGLSAPALAATVLRVTNGGLFLAHAWLKLAVFTPAGTAGYFGALGLPSWLAYATIAIEILGGLALIIGVRVRETALALIPVLLGAAYFGHAANGFWFTAEGGGWEYPVFWAITLLVLALLGAGAFALSKKEA